MTIDARGGRQSRRAVLVFLLGLLMLTGCGAKNEQAFEVADLASIAWIDEAGGIVRLAAPLHTFDTRYSYHVPTKANTLPVQTSAETLFPTMVWVVLGSAGETPKVFLARSPHSGGCLLEWNAERQRFLDNCSGSRFDPSGHYEEGPAPRDMDRLPAEALDGFLRVTNQLIYGEPVP